MAHESFARNSIEKEASDRSFGLVFCLFFITISLLPLISGRDIRLWALLAGIVLLLVSFAQPSLLSGLNKLWAKFGMLLHKATSPVLLAILFFLILSPFAVVMRLFRKDTLHYSREPDLESYWITRTVEERSKQSMLNQY